MVHVSYDKMASEAATTRVSRIQKEALPTLSYTFPLVLVSSKSLQRLMAMFKLSKIRLSLTKAVQK
jgi:hypothetical protein